MAFIHFIFLVAKHKPGLHSSEEKSVLLLGGTGTGKSTMIDALINFIAEVSYTDDYRFGLICKTDLEKERAEKQVIYYFKRLKLFCWYFLGNKCSAIVSVNLLCIFKVDSFIVSSKPTWFLLYFYDKYHHFKHYYDHRQHHFNEWNTSFL